MIIQKHVKRMPICFARDRVCVILIVRHFYCGSGVCWIDCSRVSFVRLINQCGLYVDKKNFKISGCGLYTGALNRPKITVLCDYCLLDMCECPCLSVCGYIRVTQNMSGCVSLCVSIPLSLSLFLFPCVSLSLCMSLVTSFNCDVFYFLT